ncbi:Fc.00g095640.m01.CDS01 [Cosmosporella sp. VM-42]
MQWTRVVVRCVVLLLHGMALAKATYDATICDKDRFGEFNDSLMYYPNAWNDKSPDGGFVCMKVDNSTPAVDTTWNWEADIQDVHSFPYVRFSHKDLPIRLSSLRSIRLFTKWIMTSGSPASPPRNFSNSKWKENKDQLGGDKVMANAAWDFFLDDDRNKTLYAQDAAIEFMVWLGRVGDPWWLGREENTILANLTLGKTEFSLYYGQNDGGTHVFTAVTSNGEDVLSLDEDFYPLFEFILEKARNHAEVADDLPKNPWLGVVEFGTETWFSSGNVTFTAANFGMELDGDASTGDGNNSNGGTGNNSSNGDEDNAAASTGQSILGYIVPAVLLVSALSG